VSARQDRGENHDMTPIKSPGALAARGASEIDGVEHHVVSKVNRQETFAQAPVRATLSGSHRCEAGGSARTGMHQCSSCVAN
jgi:hypothetical protein